MKKILLYSGIIITGILVPFIARYIYVRFTPETPTQLPAFTGNPPTQALTGVIDMQGDAVFIFKRDATESAKANQGETILQGETIEILRHANASVTLPNGTLIKASEPTKVGFPSLVPPHLLLHLQTGTLEVTTIEPLSIRARDTLTNISSGSASISYTENEVRTEMRDGQGKFSYIDNGNITHVWELIANTFVSLNTSTYDIETNGMLLGKVE